MRTAGAVAPLHFGHWKAADSITGSIFKHSKRNVALWRHCFGGQSTCQMPLLLLPNVIGIQLSGLHMRLHSKRRGFLLPQKTFSEPQDKHCCGRCSSAARLFVQVLCMVTRTLRCSKTCFLYCSQQHSPSSTPAPLLSNSFCLSPWLL